MHRIPSLAHVRVCKIVVAMPARYSALWSGHVGLNQKKKNSSQRPPIFFGAVPSGAKKIYHTSKVFGFAPGLVLWWYFGAKKYISHFKASRLFSAEGDP